MTAKCGVPLSVEAYDGWALRVSQFPGRGTMEGVQYSHDSLLVWSGGTSQVTLNARAQQLTKRHEFVRHGGMIDLLPKEVLFDEVSWRGEACGYVSVAFDAAKVERLLGEKVAFRPDGLRTAVTDAHVVDLVRRLQAHALAGQPWGALYAEALSLTLASYVYGRYAGAPLGAEDTTGFLPALQSERLFAFVEEHLDGRLSLTMLAALVGYSPDHFARLFKRAFGHSPYQYILERRVERAKSLLRGHTHSIAEVAVRCGFASQAHLHSAFKARTGVTPGAYRKR
jgi:AraC family transcriptional regulator